MINNKQKEKLANTLSGLTDKFYDGAGEDMSDDSSYFTGADDLTYLANDIRGHKTTTLKAYYRINKDIDKISNGALWGDMEEPNDPDAYDDASSKLEDIRDNVFDNLSPAEIHEFDKNKIEKQKQQREEKINKAKSHNRLANIKSTFDDKINQTNDGRIGQYLDKHQSFASRMHLASGKHAKMELGKRLKNDAFVPKNQIPWLRHKISLFDDKSVYNESTINDDTVNNPIPLDKKRLQKINFDTILEHDGKISNISNGKDEKEPALARMKPLSKDILKSIRIAKLNKVNHGAIPISDNKLNHYLHVNKQFQHKINVHSATQMINNKSLIRGYKVMKKI